ncbi:hypothetical protein [Ekhidna sp.]|uniref:hypothetical protein n=1 Tax=Ekhidna sp. TaxID=2608089 RepID=UPI0032F091F2
MWKKLFWISFILLVVTNIYWMYQLLDSGVSITYLRESYDYQEKDIDILRKLVEQHYDFNKLTSELDEADYELIQKGDIFFIVFSSFEVEFNSDSTIKRTRNFFEP